MNIFEILLALFSFFLGFFACALLVAIVIPRNGVKQYAETEEWKDKP